MSILRFGPLMLYNDQVGVYEVLDQLALLVTKGSLEENWQWVLVPLAELPHDGWFDLHSIAPMTGGNTYCNDIITALAIARSAASRALFKEAFQAIANLSNTLVLVVTDNSGKGQ